MALQLITETVQKVCTLVEGETRGAPKVYAIQGIFMQGNVKNQNGRVYPTNTLVREMARFQTEYINRHRAFGELGHPDSPTVNLDRVSHLITNLQQEGDNFVGRAKVMTETPMGKIVKALIDEGAELGVSTRGLGTLTETEQGMEVGDDFFLSTIDIVADPSAPEAFVRGVMEGKAWVWESGVLKECALDKLVKKIDAVHAPTVPSPVRQEAFVKSFGRFMTALREGVSSNIQER